MLSRLNYSRNGIQFLDKSVSLFIRLGVIVQEPFGTNKHMFEFFNIAAIQKFKLKLPLLFIFFEVKLVPFRGLNGLCNAL